jgi:hypothetical protein
VRIGIRAVLLTQEDFDRLTAPRHIPFAAAFVTDQSPYLALIPMGDQTIVNQMYLPRQNQATAETRERLKTAKVTYAEAASKFMIHLVLHEIGHLQVTRYEIEPPNYWVTEFLCNYLSYAYLKAEKPRLALVVEALNLVPNGAPATYLVGGFRSPLS